MTVVTKATSFCEFAWSGNNAVKTVEEKNLQLLKWLKNPL